MTMGQQTHCDGNRHWIGNLSERLAATLRRFDALAGIALLAGLFASGLMPTAERVVATAAKLWVGCRQSARTPRCWAARRGGCVGGRRHRAAVGIRVGRRHPSHRLRGPAEPRFCTTNLDVTPLTGPV